MPKWYKLSEKFPPLNKELLLAKLIHCIISGRKEWQGDYEFYKISRHWDENPHKYCKEFLEIVGSQGKSDIKRSHDEIRWMDPTEEDEVGKGIMDNFIYSNGQCCNCYKEFDITINKTTNEIIEVTKPCECGAWSGKNKSRK